MRQSNLLVNDKSPPNPSSIVAGTRLRVQYT